MDWTTDQDLSIAGIMASETMHDPENTSGDHRIRCTRMEAIRRMRRRTKGVVYVVPTGAVLAAATLPLAAERTPAQLAVLEANRYRRPPSPETHHYA
jgi:hypothetical protein